MADEAVFRFVFESDSQGAGHRAPTGGLPPMTTQASPVPILTPRKDEASSPAAGPDSGPGPVRSKRSEPEISAPQAAPGPAPASPVDQAEPPRPAGEPPAITIADVDAIALSKLSGAIGRPQSEGPKAPSAAPAATQTFVASAGPPVISTPGQPQPAASGPAMAPAPPSPAGPPVWHAPQPPQQAPTWAQEPLIVTPNAPVYANPPAPKPPPVPPPTPPPLPKPPPAPKVPPPGPIQRAGQQVFRSTLQGGIYAGAGTAGAIAVPTLAELGPIGIAAAGVVLTFSAIVETGKRLKEALDETANSIADYSPQVSGAKLENELLEEFRRFRVAREHGTDFAAIVRAEGETSRAIKDALDQLMVEFAPAIVGALRTITASAEFIKDHADEIKKALWVAAPKTALLLHLLEQIADSLPKDPSTDVHGMFLNVPDMPIPNFDEKTINDAKDVDQSALHFSRIPGLKLP